MPDWLLTLLVGGIIVGLIGVIYNSVTGRISKLEGWKENRPSVAEVLTVARHFELCKQNTKELKDFIKEELEEVKREIRKANGS
jgi:hypothetical protein